MRQIYQYVIAISTILIMTGCATTDYQILAQNNILKKNTSIVLIGIKGKHKVNYLQFESWSKMPPACNYRFSEVKDNIIALKIDTPQEEYKLGVYTPIGSSAGYTHTGIAYGYIPVESKGLNIKERGIYYYGILNTDTQTVNQRIDTKFLNKAKKKYKSLLSGLKPINFKW